MFKNLEVELPVCINPKRYYVIAAQLIRLSIVSVQI